jgi:hypothetical protein
LDITTYTSTVATYNAAYNWIFLTNVALWYNDSIRCGAEMGLNGAVASIAVGLAAIGLM